MRRFFSEYATNGESHITATTVSIKDFSYLNLNIIIIMELETKHPGNVGRYRRSVRSQIY
jgi:hypothetical protein